VTTHASQPRSALKRPAIAAAIAAAGSAVVAMLLFTAVTTPAYAWAITVCLAAGAGAVAVVDARTHILPNRYVSTFAAAGLVQAVAAAFASHAGISLLDPLIAATAVYAAYVLLGLIGWFGFGDAKFAGALTVTVAIYAGLAAIYIVPLAILFAALWMLFCRALGRVPRTRAHGPAIALAAIGVMVAAVLLAPPRA
jgi:leader peptidase (prepilin peptidase)/N-methyltransferase